MACAFFTVNLSQIHSATHLQSTYANVLQGQSSSQYTSSLAQTNGLVLNLSPEVRGMEGIYHGWCGSYDNDHLQPAAAIDA
jgi:hypothetical protein